MSDLLLTITQALQLVAIAPCLFVIVFLLCAARRGADNVLPILYFLSLCASFLLPLTDIFGMKSDRWLTGLLLLGESATPALAFLLIMQFLLGRVPPLSYWLILALPFLGGSPFILASLYSPEACIGADMCYGTVDLRMLYGVFSTALICLLLIYRISFASARIAVDDADRRHKYWLIVALVCLHVAGSAIALLEAAGHITPANGLLALTGLRIAFIYLVLTSIFRVFYDLFDIALLPEAKEKPTHPAKAHAQDRETVNELKALLERECIYREMGLTRSALAERLRISEHQASRVINAYFKKNFNELVNGYRVEEAKSRLMAEDTAVTVIAFEVGFRSIGSFNRVFKDMVGISPSEFRAGRKQATA